MIVGMKELREDEIDRKAEALRSMDRDDDRRAGRREGLDAALGDAPEGRHPAFGRLFTAPTLAGLKLVPGEVSKDANEPEPVAKAAAAPLTVKPDSRFTLNAVYVARDGGTPSADELEQATWQFDRGGDYSVHDADSGAQVGEVVEIAFNRSQAEGGFNTAPWNSVCAGIIWTPEAFPRAAKGQIRPRLGGPFAGFAPEAHTQREEPS